MTTHLRTHPSPVRRAAASGCPVLLACLTLATACDRGTHLGGASDTTGDGDGMQSTLATTAADGSGGSSSTQADSSDASGGAAEDSSQDSGPGSTTSTTSTGSTSSDSASSDSTTDDTQGDDTGEDPDEAACGREVAPGPRLVDGANTGSNTCQAVTLSEFIVRVHAEFPALADIDVIYDPDDDDGTGEGTYIHAYEDQQSGGFALAFERGQGDCESGCIDREWTYVQSGEECAPMAAGYYHPQWQQDPKCLNNEGVARWNTPTAPDPIHVCGEDQSARDISGDYPAHIRGVWQPCTELGPDEPEVEIDQDIRVVVTQRGDDLAKGTIELKGLAYEKISRAFNAEFERERGHVNFNEGVPVDEFQLQMTIDFEGCVVPELHSFEVIEFDDGAYCKGSMNANIRLLNE